MRYFKFTVPLLAGSTPVLPLSLQGYKFYISYKWQLTVWIDIKQISARKIIEIHDILVEKFGGEPGIIYEGSIYFIPEKAALKRSIEEAACVYLFES